MSDDQNPKEPALTAGGPDADKKEERNPWKQPFWNVTDQGRYLTTHGVKKAREMAYAAGLDPDKVGLKEEPQPVKGLVTAFVDPDARTQFEKTVASGARPKNEFAGPNYEGYMRRKHAGKTISGLRRS
jgi:hypothetical protein